MFLHPLYKKARREAEQNRMFFVFFGLLFIVAITISFTSAEQESEVLAGAGLVLGVTSTFGLIFSATVGGWRFWQNAPLGPTWDRVVRETQEAMSLLGNPKEEEAVKTAQNFLWSEARMIVLVEQAIIRTTRSGLERQGMLLLLVPAKDEWDQHHEILRRAGLVVDRSVREARREFFTPGQ